MLTESMPTSTAPASISHCAPSPREERRADAVLRPPEPAVPAGVQQHGRAAHVAIGEGRRAGCRGARRDHASSRWKTSARSPTSVVEVEPREIGPFGVAVERRVEVGAGVADHRDDVHRELGARRVPRAGVLAREVRRDRRRGQARVGDEPGADRMAEVDDAASAPAGAASATPRLPRCGSSTMRRPAQRRPSSTSASPRCSHEQQPDLVASTRSADGRSSRKPVPARLTAVGEADVEVEVGAVLGHARPA